MLRLGPCFAGVLAALAMLASAGCGQRSSLTSAPRPDETGGRDGAERPATPPDARQLASRLPAAGASCEGRGDCSSDQVCVGGRCRYRNTSVRGELLASAAEAQARSGDGPGASQTYEQAFGAFVEAGAPVPPDVACAAAELTLRSATDAETRERGGRRADLCFRSTLPGDPRRTEVAAAIARLRHEGLDLGAFDREEPAERFFSGETSRPSIDAVRIVIDMPDLAEERPSHGTIRDGLQDPEGTLAIAECFLADWEVRHDRSAAASVIVRYRTQLRDLGTHEVYDAIVEVEQTVAGDEGFEPCVARALAGRFAGERRQGRSEAWTQAIRVTARLQ